VDVLGYQAAIGEAPLLAQYYGLLGMLAGGGMAFGMTVGESLLKERVRLGRLLGGVLLGGLGAAIVTSPLLMTLDLGPGGNLLATVGSGLFGMLTGTGIALPRMIPQKRPITLGGGMAGATLGIIVWSALGFLPGQAVPVLVLLVSGGIVGSAMTLSIAWVEARRVGGQLGGLAG
jgi:hypothetical protein